jgi:hypothetical protein
MKKKIWYIIFPIVFGIGYFGGELIDLSWVTIAFIIGVGLLLFIGGIGFEKGWLKKGWWDKHWWNKHPWLSSYLVVVSIPALVIMISSSQGITLEEYIKNYYEKLNDWERWYHLIALIGWACYTIYILWLSLLEVVAIIIRSNLLSGFSISKGQKQYRVYKNPQNIYQAVKVGWSFPAFFFEIFWCLVKQLWIYAGIIFFGWIFCFILGDIFDWIFTFAVMIWLGTQGNDLYAKSLQERGYDFLTTLSAKTPEGAIAQYQKDAQKDKED